MENKWNPKNTMIIFLGMALVAIALAEHIGIFSALAVACGVGAIALASANEILQNTDAQNKVS